MAGSLARVARAWSVNLKDGWYRARAPRHGTYGAAGRDPQLPSQFTKYGRCHGQVPNHPPSGGPTPLCVLPVSSRSLKKAGLDAVIRPAAVVAFSATSLRFASNALLT